MLIVIYSLAALVALLLGVYLLICLLTPELL